MATENPGKTISLQAAADLSAAQFLFVKVTAADTVNLAGNGEAAIGVLQDKPAAAGRPGNVMIDGVSKIVAGAAFAAGALLSSDAAGKAVVPATGEYILGIAKTAAGALNEVAEIILVSHDRAP